MALAGAFAFREMLRGAELRVDDASIVARYAENLVHHGQLTWNVGEPPVEGFTGYSLLGVMIIATLLHVSPLSAALALGIVSLGAGAALVLRAHEPLGASPLAGSVAAALFLGAAEQVTHATSGLETELFIALTVACAFIAVSRAHLPPGAGRLWPLPLVATALVFTRPEGLAVAGAFLLVVVIRERAALRVWLFWTGLLTVLPVAALQLFRRIHFGGWLPNTYYAKLGNPGEQGAFAASFGEHFQAYFLPAVVAMIATAIVARALGRPVTPLPAPVKSARQALLLGAAPGYLALSWSYLRSDLVMGYSDRFAFHLFGLSSLLFLLAVAEVDRRLRSLRESAPAHSATFVLACAALYLPFANAMQRAPKERAFRDSYARATETHLLPTARLLKEILPPDATLAVYPDAGVVPYSTMLRTVDFGKLNDTYLAREATGTASVAEYFFDRSPDALMISLRAGLARTYDEGGDRILSDPRFEPRYRLVRLSLRDGGGLALFVKR
ncbi:MAG: hypothetical protein R3F14_34035 [Polyangiaceae bacterium]